VIRRLGWLGAAVLFVTLALPAAAFAHAEMSPKVSLSGQLQLYSLAVPTEKSGAATTRIDLTLPNGFAIDSFVASPGWHRTVQQSGSGDTAVVEKVTWTGGHVPTGEDSLFQFLAQPAKAGTYTFTVRQTYSDGSVVDWSGPESADAPAPRIDVVDSVGGGGTPTLSIIAVILGAVALAGAGLALASGRGGGGGRPLA
jgi:uncharacterized protein YcnI